MTYITDLSPVERPKNAEPWKRLSSPTKLAVLASILVPAAIFLTFISVTGTDFMAGLWLVFLPIQILAAMAAGFTAFRSKGLMDSLLYVVTLFFSAFVLVLLLSVIWSLVEAGSKAMSWHMPASFNPDRES